MLSRILICLSLVCVADYVVFHHTHGTLPWRMGIAFSVGAVIVIIVTKCSGLRFAVPVALLLILVQPITIGWRYLFVDLEGAINLGDIGLIRWRIAQGSDVNDLDSNGQTMLTSACSYWEIGDKGKKDFDKQQAKICQMLEMLIDSGASVNNLDDLFGQAPLHRAVHRQMYRVVQLLLAKGADPNLKDHYGNTALHHAVTPPLYPYGQDGTMDIVELLIRSGADVNLKNNNGRTPLGLVLNEQHHLYRKIAELLRKHGAKE